MRVIHAARELTREGNTILRTIALHSEREQRAVFVREADEAVRIPQAWRHDLEPVARALRQVRADALWCAPTSAREDGKPAELAELCRRLELAFVGPSLTLLEHLADPAALRGFAQASGWALEGPGPRGRRVELIVLADHRGTVWIPAVTDVTLQRAGRSMLAECPAPMLAPQAEQALQAAALGLARQLALVGIITVEASVAQTGAIAFVALHAGLHNQHAVEASTGLDFTKLQLGLAGGGVLEGDLPGPRGHAVAVRLTREDPEHDFSSTIGVIDRYRPPSGPALRLDPGVAEGDYVFDDGPTTLTTLVAWGQERREALARLSCGLRDTSLVIRGGATNKACLMALCAHPEVVDLKPGLEIADGWLDRQLAIGECIDQSHADVALFAVAIDAYSLARQREAARFFHTAEHGRPRLGTTGGDKIALRHHHTAYAFVVSQISADTYRIEIGRGSHCDVRVEPVGDDERRLLLAGRSHRVRCVAAGLHYAVEVDGVPRQVVVEDTLRVIRSPSPAVVLRLAVHPGTVVAAGQTVVVLEAMKMEITVEAPTAGLVREVLVTPSSQVDLDAPLLVYDKLQTEGSSVADGALLLPDDAAGVLDDPRHRFLRAYAELRRLLFGYDADTSDARAITSEWKIASSGLPATDHDLVGAEHHALQIFADLQSLVRRQPQPVEDADGSNDDDEFASAQEHLGTFLRSLSSAGAGLPPSFLAVMERAVAHYGVTSLRDSPGLRDALQRIYRSHERADAQALVIAAILDRRLAAVGTGEAAAGEEFHVLLNHLIGAARRRHPVVHELALEVRHALFDAPMFERTRDAIYRRALACIDELETSATPEVRMAVQALVDCPQPLIALLAPRFATAGPATRAAMLEALTKRNYRTRGLRDIQVREIDGAHYLTASYRSDHHDVTVITTYAARQALTDAVRRVAKLIRSASDATQIVVDFITWSQTPLSTPGEDEAEVRAALTAGDLPADLRRIVVATAAPGGGPGPIHCVTYRSGDRGYSEDALYRGVHPVIGERMHFWRLAEFHLERLPSVEDVYLFRAIAKGNPRDERVFAMAEVRDLTPVRDDAGRIVQLPYLERVLGEALAAIRRVQAARPTRDRLQWNRVILQFWDTLTLTPAELDGVVRHLAPATEGLGIEQVMVYARMPTRDGELRDVVLRIANTLDGGLHVRLTDPPSSALTTLTEYEQKVISLRRRGLIYPYEIIHLLTPTNPDDAGGFARGDFVEYDLDPSGVLTPVMRPHGENSANIVIGILRSFTAEVPEGINRVVLLGDASKEMGSLSEPECRRILAAIDLAEQRSLPLEWFALSAGAKISRQSGTENMDWISVVLRRIIEFTQRRGEINVVVCGINVGAQPYWNAEATMLMHTRGILIMIGDSAMVLTGKQALDYSGSTSADDNHGIGGYERIMGRNGQAQYWAPDIGAACQLLLRHYAHTYVVPGERFPRTAATADPPGRDVQGSPHPGTEFTTVGAVFGPGNADRKRPFDIRAVMRAVSDQDHEPLERWRDMRDAEIGVVWDAHLGGRPVCLLGFESHALPRRGFAPGDGPVQWTSGTLFPRASKKIARAVNAASGNRPLLVIANLAGFDGSPESMLELQLEYGAEIGRAVVNFDGPIVFCVVSRYHGGAFVVFSKKLNEQMEVIALEGARASVIGGAPAAAVVFARDVDTRTSKDQRLLALEDAIAKAAPADKAGLRERLAALRPLVRSEKLGEVADEFDQIHSVQRALQMGSLDRIVPVASLRPVLIEALERGVARTMARWLAAAQAGA
jgi:acetyl/propionyl-CoA carboxylase alpha subunit/acetyl-CoA carboxylase carboxyltransferase component